MPGPLVGGRRHTLSECVLRFRLVLVRLWPDLLVVALYTGMAVFAYWDLWTAHGAAVPAAGGPDPALNVWFLT
jgi:hypothetical protein